MKIARSLLLLAMAVVGTGPGTVGLSVLSPPGAARSQSTPQKQRPAPPGTIRVQVRLVPVDVIVTDSTGRPVTDLRQEDFQVFENGRLQEIRHFAVQALTPAAPAVVRQPAAPAAQSTEFSPQSSRTFLILMSRGWFQRPFRSVDALIRFVRQELLPQDRVAVFAFNRATDFTTDHERIAQVLERFKKEHEWIEALERQRMSGLAAIYGSKEMPKSYQKRIDNIFVDSGALGSRQLPPGRMAEENRMAGEADRTTETLLRKAAVDEALKAGDPGAALRQAMMQFDTLAAEAITDLPFSEYAAGFATTQSSVQNIFTCIDYLRFMEGQKHLLFFTPSGLYLPRVEDDASIAAYANDARVAVDTFQTGGLNPGRSWSETFAITSLRNVSNLTGGRASIYQDVGKGLSQVNETTRFEYLLGYYPKDEHWDGRYRRIEVKVNRPGMKVAFRNGYYARDTLQLFDREEMLTYRRITSAGNYVGDLSDVPFRVYALLDDFDPGRINVHLNINPADIGLAIAEDGRHTGKLRIVIYYADAKGNYLGDIWTTVDLSFPDETYKNLLLSGVSLSLAVPARTPRQLLKVIIYDIQRDRVGSQLIRMK